MRPWHDELLLCGTQCPKVKVVHQTGATSIGAERLVLPKLRCYAESAEGRGSVQWQVALTAREAAQTTHADSDWAVAF